MKKHLLLLLLFCGLLSATTISYGKMVNPQKAPPDPLHFLENKGQVTDQHRNSRSDIDFRIQGSGVSMFVGNGALHYQWSKPIGKIASNQQQTKVALYRMDVNLVGANTHAKVITEQKQPFYEKYYLPVTGEQGATAFAYQKITYKEIYPNIDWVLYIKDNTVEYDFVVREGGNVSDIKLQYNGAAKLSIDNSGSLTATTPMGSTTENAPHSFQQDGKPIASRFVLQGNTLSFAVAPHSGTLTIDPSLSWATYYGGNMDDFSRAGNVTGDTSGNVYLSGHTSSTANIATTGSYQDTITTATDAFLVKFNNAGTRKWATYYGGNGSETAFGLACDNTGAIYLSGYTTSTNGIASTGAYQTTVAGQDAFLAKFDTAGSRQWGTYYGGSGNEQGLGVTCDANNNVYLTGYTQSSTGIATTGAQQATLGGSSDAFIVKFSSTGTRKWCSYYGGSSAEQGWSVACDTNKNVYLSGYTQSATGIATTGAQQTTIGGGQDGFLVKFDSTGVRQWATYYGGTAADRALSTACDPTGNVYITGYSASATNIATTGAHQTTFGGTADAFIAKFNTSGVRQWGTYYGDAGDDEGYDITADALGHIYVTGFTNSTTAIATPGAIKDTLDFQDAFLAKFDTAGVLLMGTYFGGEASDLGYGVYCNALSKVYISGVTSSYTNLATTSGFQTAFGGGTYDAFLAKFDDCQLTAPISITGNDTVCRNGTYTYTTPAVTGALSYQWTLPSGWSGTSTTNNINVTTASAGTSNDTITIAAQFLCGTSTPVKKGIVVSALPTLTPSGTISLCNGDSIILSTDTGSTYIWLQDGLTIAGANAHQYNAHTAHLYAVITTNTLGCSDTSTYDTIIVHPTPVPIISASGMVLSTGTYVTYQWNHNGTPITGATTGTYTVTLTSGTYSVTVTDTNGCSGTSANFDATVLSVNDIHKNATVNSYPNPVTDYLCINSAEKVNAAISSIDGRELGHYENVTNIDMRQFADGVYLLRLTDTQGSSIGTQKIVKQSNK